MFQHKFLLRKKIEIVNANFLRIYRSQFIMTIQLIMQTIQADLLFKKLIHMI